MTNLTDEGLRALIGVELSRFSECPTLETMDWTTDKIMEIFATALQQVRDAAKKEERESCASLADYLMVKTKGLISASKVATAIRQMDGGK